LAGIPPTEGQYQEIGRFFHEFPQVEFSLRFVLAQMTKIPSDYFDIVTAPYDTNALCNVVKALAKKAATPEHAQPLIDVVKRFQSLNGERVRVAHGTWSEGDDGLTSRHVSRTSLEPDWHYGRAGDLAKLVEEAVKLQTELLIAGLEALSDMGATTQPEEP
jgi:hypothetical protein